MYFITICTKNRECILSNININKDSIVGVEDPLNPNKFEIYNKLMSNQNNVKLKQYGTIAEKYMKKIKDAYQNTVNINTYVIMPNHIHLIIEITSNGSRRSSTPYNIKNNSSDKIID